MIRDSFQENMEEWGSIMVELLKTLWGGLGATL